ncbi:MAG: MBL fold metallo-hydrolase [Anaerolineae bacterium]|nr:MBL fold metallo-hydrolase [Anaerolineae bacterium]
MSQLPPIEKFTTRGGVTIYRLPMMVFPGFIGYSYLILNAGVPTLVDCGSGIGESNDHLLAGIRAVADEFGEKLTVKDIKHILITHGHIDHFGGTAFMIEQTGALVGIHELDRRVLTAYEERVIMATKDLRVYLERAGMDDAERTAMMEMYGFAKKNIRSVKVDFSLDEDVFFEGMQFIHVPGHCPGQVAILIDEVLLSADHILSRTTPHQAPESITHYTGLGHYKDSLRKIEKVDGIELALGGHEDPIRNFYERVRDIRASHDRKLNRVLDIIKNAGHPVTIREVTHLMYPDKTGYDTLLALEEAGAHIEYLYQHGMISVDNLHQVEDEDNPALQYLAS